MENTIILYQRVENPEAGQPVCRLAVEFQDKIQRVLEFALAPSSQHRDAEHLGLERVLAYLIELAGKDQRFGQMRAAVLTADAALVRQLGEDMGTAAGRPHASCLERLHAVRQAYAGFELLRVDPVLIECALQGVV